MLHNRCPYCSGALRFTRLTCEDCGLGLEGEFATPRLSRLDLVPLLVDAVQTYTEHERETLTELTQARANAIQVTGAIGDAPQTVEQLKAIEASQGEVESALARLFAIVENYPDLKASRTSSRSRIRSRGRRTAWPWSGATTTSSRAATTPSCRPSRATSSPT